MRLPPIVVALGLVVPAFSYTVSYTMSYDTIYDHGENPLDNVACPDGEHGVLTAGYTTFNSLPTFPYIGGVPQIVSPYCGTCWQLMYTDAYGVSSCVNITAIDTGGETLEEFNTSQEGMDVLTGGNAVRLSRAPITAARLPKSACGL